MCECLGYRQRKFTDVRTHPDRLAQPLRWKKPRRVFVNSMSDLFHEDVPFEFIDRVFVVMMIARKHTFQILTKRPERMASYILDPATIGRVIADFHDVTKSLEGSHVRTRDNNDDMGGFVLPNVWLGVSVENQKYAGRLYDLARTPAAVRFCSYEPALEHVRFDRIEIKPGLFWSAITGAHEAAISSEHIQLPGRLPGLDWLIFGGESGPGARECDLDWARDVWCQCGILTKFFMKQAGAAPFDSALTITGRNESLHLKDRKGGDMEEWPGDLRVREFPK